MSRAQLLRAGVSDQSRRRLVRDGLAHPVVPGVTALGAEPGWLGRAWTGLLLGGSTSVLGLEAAGYLHGFVRQEPQEIAVFVAPEVVLSPRPGWRFYRRERVGRGEPTRTPAGVTAIDLCERTDEDGVTALLADVVSGRYSTTRELLAEVEGRSRVARRPLLRDILGDVAGGCHSPLERHYALNVERAHGLPEAVRQARVGARHRTDALYDSYRLLVELDGKIYHSGSRSFHDLTRDLDHAQLGLHTVRLGWSHVTGVASCLTARAVGGMLIARGWEGPITPCRRCRLMPAR